MISRRTIRFRYKCGSTGRRLLDSSSFARRVRNSACPTVGYIALRAWSVPTDNHGAHLRFWSSTGCCKYNCDIAPGHFPSPFNGAEIGTLETAEVTRFSFSRSKVSTNLLSKQQFEINYGIVFIFYPGVESSGRDLQSRPRGRDLREPVEERPSDRSRNSPTASRRENILAIPFPLLQARRSLPAADL